MELKLFTYVFNLCVLQSEDARCIAKAMVTLSQFQSITIRRSAKNVVRQILKLQNCERVGREIACP